MARIRTVKPELFRHEELFAAEMDYKLPLRLSFIGLFACCDREGRFKWRPQQLKLDIFPYDNLDLALVLKALEERGFIHRYECQGKWYGCIPSWPLHQKIDHHEKQSSIPAPFEELSEVIKSSPNALKPLKNSSFDVKNKSNVTPLNAALPGNASACLGMPGGNMEGNREKEREYGIGNRERNNTIVASRMRPGEKLEAVQQIFEHWKTVMNHPNAKLDPKRQALIKKALSFGYGEQELCEAISGCSVTPHNMGDNDQNQRYDGLHVIFRDADQIDRFIHHYHCPPQPKSAAAKRTQANIDTLKRWANKKMVEEKLHASK